MLQPILPGSRENGKVAPKWHLGEPCQELGLEDDGSRLETPPGHFVSGDGSGRVGVGSLPEGLLGFRE